MTRTPSSKCRFCNTTTDEPVHSYTTEGLGFGRGRRSGSVPTIRVTEHPSCLARYEAEQAERDARYAAEREAEYTEIRRQLAAGS